MEISNCKEVILLCEALHNGLHSNFPCEFYELLEDIFIGLSHQHESYERLFLKTKIVYVLLTYALENCENTAFLNLTHMELYKCDLSWDEFFEIIIKGSLISNLSSLLLSTSSAELFVFVTKNFKKYCQQKMECDEFVIYLTVCVGEIYSNNELNDEGFIDIFLKEILFLLEGVESFTISVNFNFQSLTEATEMFNLKHREILELETKQTVIDYEKFQTLLIDAEADKKKLSKLIDDENDVYETNFSAGIQEVQKKCLNSIIALKQIWETLLSNEPDEAQKPNSKSIEIFLSCLSDAINDINNTSPSKSITESKMEIDFDLALFITKNSLLGYNDAVSYLISGLLSLNYTIEDIDTCYNCFNKNFENLLQIDHVISLIKFTSTLVEPTFIKWKILISKCFEKLSMDIKRDILAVVLTDDFLKRFGTFFLLNNEVKSDFKREINVKYNTVSRLDSLNSEDRILKVMCESGFICPSYSIEKFIELILYQDEHNQVFANSLLKVPLLGLYTTQVDGNTIVNFMMQKILLEAREKILNRAIKFLLKLLELSREHCKDGVINVAEFILNDILIRYIFSFLATPNNRKLVAFSVTYISGVYNLERFHLLELFELFSLSYLLARVLDISEYSDNILETLKETLHLTIEAACLKYSESDSKLLTWFLNVSKSLSWKTQLYLRPLLCKHEDYNTCLPKSITDICQHDFSIETLDNCTEGTGLTIWFQCMIINPGLLPISSLTLDNFSTADQELFGHGVVIALTQILPECTEKDWQVIINCIQVLINQHILNVQCTSIDLKTLPLFDLLPCKVPISIAVILHRVTGLLRSSCCDKWMSLSKWDRVSTNYGIAMKSILTMTPNSNSTPSDLFCICNLFSNALDLLVLLETVNNSEKSANSVFVLCLDLLTVFGNGISSFYDLSREDEDLKYEYCALLNDATRYKRAMMSMVEMITNQKFEDTLTQKLLNILPE